MQMSNTEILSSYKQAADRKKQVQILADLNSCDKKVIKQILIEGGISAEELDGRRKQGSEKPVAKTPKEVSKSATHVQPKEVSEPQKKTYSEPKLEVLQTTVPVPEVVLDVVKAYRDSLIEELDELNNFLKLHGID